MMKRIVFAAITGLIITLLLPACKTQQKINRNYFSQDTRDSSHERVWQDYQIRIQKRDRLAISISALNPQSAQIFNFRGGTEPGASGAAGAYFVDEEGNILIPQLGFIHVEGYTRSQVRDTLMKRLSQYLIDPIVAVEFTNLKVTIVGEVEQQGPVPLTDGRITLLEALGKAGDILGSGRRDSVLVIREINNERKFGTVNLLSNDAFKSEYFMLQQNDVVYVPMIKSKASAREDKSEATFIEKSLPIISILTSISSLVWLIYSITR